MLLKKLRNISFAKKMTIIFAVVCTVLSSIAGLVYYKFAKENIVENFRENAEGLVRQLENTIDTRLEAVNRRAFAALTNSSFIQPLSNYITAPDIQKEVSLSAEAAHWLKDISLAEPLVHSAFIYTEQGSWDDYTRVRNWKFNFEKSVFRKIYRDANTHPIQWMPTMKDEIFEGNENVIPYVRQFNVGQWNEYQAYLIIQLDQKVLVKELLGASTGLGEIIITDSQGAYIAGTESVGQSKLKMLKGMNKNKKNIGYSGNIEYKGKQLYVYKGVVDINGWQIYFLKSEEELLNSLQNVRKWVIVLSVILIACSLILIAFLSRQLTGSLHRLSIQMNRMRSGELEARYYYPYKDEIGSLAQSFNYMADQVEKSMRKQDEYISVLKEERNFVEQVQKQKRKAELRALQAQINPHFLYNTLNTITWLASDQGLDEISTLSNSLGKLFRISLSKGAEVISIEEEVEHVRCYLTIQEIRYSEIMNYKINISEEVRSCTILKLVLQPLVENSIYHGIKEKESASTIYISANKNQTRDGKTWIQFEVKDTGIGISPGKLKKINECLEEGTTDNREGYGIFNVNERIKLYYGREYGLHYESCEGEWTKVTLKVPVQRREEHDV